jgi:hypothetical protein
MSFFSNLSTLFGSNQKQPGGKKVVKPVVSKPGQPQPPSRPTPPQSPVKPIQPKTPPPVRPMPREQVATVSEVEL